MVKVGLGGWVLQGPVADLAKALFNHGAGAQLQLGGARQFYRQIPVQPQFQ